METNLAFGRKITITDKECDVFSINLEIGEDDDGFYISLDRRDEYGDTDDVMVIRLTDKQFGTLLQMLPFLKFKSAFGNSAEISDQECLDAYKSLCQAYGFVIENSSFSSDVQIERLNYLNPFDISSFAQHFGELEKGVANKKPTK